MARAMFGNPMLQYLNALTIAANQAISDTGATLIFVMEGANVANKCVVTSPLTIYFPDSKKIQSTHVCDINIPGLPMVLVGHIAVLLLIIASLLAFGPFAKPDAWLHLTMKSVMIYLMGRLSQQGSKTHQQIYGCSLFHMGGCEPPQIQ